MDIIKIINQYLRGFLMGFLTIILMRDGIFSHNLYPLIVFILIFITIFIEILKIKNIKNKWEI